MATAPKTAPKTAAPAGGTAALRVVSKSPMGTLRRAGLVFGTQPTIVLLSEITPEQAKSIKAEPLLDVTDTTAEAAAPEANKA
jgi:hypothetical protein